MKILIINGPNMNLLGLREPDIYGRLSYADLVSYIRAAAEQEKMDVSFIQSNHEGVLIDAVQEAYGVYDGIVINPAAYTHTSIALGDALKAIGLPAVEVHMSDISNRESYRSISYTKDACIAQICGLGFAGYAQALHILKERLMSNHE